MKKNFVKRMMCLLAVVVLAADATGCGIQELSVSGTGFVSGLEWNRKLGRVFTEPGSISVEPGGASGEHKQESEAVLEDQSGFSMGSVPYFRDDAGKNTQTVDGYLYGYWNNRLCRYDLETLEETVLYEALSSQNGDFCIWGDYVYFMVVPNVSAVGKIHGYLYRVPCDGSEEAVCLTSVVMPGQEGNYYNNFTLDTYQDILYLIQQYGGEEKLYFRLQPDGSITRARESETLYGQLPEGDFTAFYNSHNKITLPYAMRNFGYVFMKDENGDPVRIDLDSGQVEVLEVLKDYRICDVTNDAVLVSKDNVWYRVPLDDIDEVQEIGSQSDNRMSFVAWDAKGIYFSDLSYDGYGRLCFKDWKGEDTTLRYRFSRKQYSPLNFFDGEYYYYVAEDKGNDVVRRLKFSENNDTEPEEVGVYEEDLFQEITSSEQFDYGWTDTRTGANVDYSLTKVFFRDDTGAYGRINDFLEDLYARDMASFEQYKEMIKEGSEEYWEEWGAADYVQYSDGYYMLYMDEKYVCIGGFWDQYWMGAAHGTYGSISYVFDRNTGKRVSITDVVNNPPEEICDIIAPYVEAVAVWGTDDEGWENMLLEEDRFFLTEEGIGIHFDVYEIDCYAAGAQDIIVPYSMFERDESF